MSDKQKRFTAADLRNAVQEELESERVRRHELASALFEEIAAKLRDGKYEVIGERKVLVKLRRWKVDAVWKELVLIAEEVGMKIDYSHSGGFWIWQTTTVSVTV